MPWGAAAAAAATVAGSMISADAAQSAANTSADAQRYAANQAAEAAKFKPYGVTTGFGTASFDTGNQTATYTLTPEMQAIRDKLIAQAGAYDTSRIGELAQPLAGGATTLFGLGKQYLATSPEQARQDYINQQLAALAPSREQQLASIRNNLFQTGRTGLATGGTTTGMGASNPELQAYYNSLQNQNLTLASQAEQAAQQRQQFGAGLFGTGANLLGQVPSLTTQGYGPLQTQLGVASTIEGLGQNALDIGAQLGGRSATAGQNVAQSLLTGGLSAAKTLQAANQYSVPGAALTGLGSNQQFQNWFAQKLGQNPDGLSYNPGSGYGTATGYQSWDYSNPELMQTQQTYGV